MPCITGQQPATQSTSVISSLTSRAPVWSQSRLEEDLLKLYAEEIAMVETLEEADADVGHVTATSRNDSATPGVNTYIFPEPVFDEQQVCRIYPAQATTLLFDISADISHESVSHMLGDDSNNNHKTQETAYECTLTRPSRSLRRPPPVRDDTEREELWKEEQPLLDTQAEVDRVLSLIPGNVFLPGHSQLSNVEVRATFITYDSDIKGLQQATAKFLADRRSSEYFDNKKGYELPGENFLLAENTTNVGLSIQHPTAESLLSLIDELVDSDSLVEDVSGTMPHFEQQPLSTPYAQQSSSEEAPRRSTIFESFGYQYTGYTALDQLMSRSGGVSRSIYAQYHAAVDVSDIIDGEVGKSSMTQFSTFGFAATDELTMSEPCELTFFDAYNQQPIAYTAFNQLLVDLDNDETLSRIHHWDDDLNEDSSSLVAGVLEIGELSGDSNTTELARSLPNTNDLSGFDFDLNCNFGPCPTQTAPIAENAAGYRSIDSLRSYKFQQRLRCKRRAFLAIDTQLANIVEVSANEDVSLPSSSSDSSIEFTGQCGFVQELSVRRPGFLDDEEYDDDMEETQSAPSPVSPDDPASTSAHTSHVAESTCELYSDDIWHSEPSLPLTLSHTPTRPTSLSDFGSLDHDTLDAIETEILGLIAHAFECMSQGEFDNLQALGSDLQWASNAITEVCPRLGLIAHLSTVVEILLERIVTLSSN
ncbi:hypothetical protein DE146DRAFT_148037 [Phaeosphaeria sp. MPI-PUGE-AT-0046c]|nr:hypothetical protein DE146DRAFT_148037 [Phaeosphaeria sp. MPI-PUGE-AT-0046c]